MVKHTMPCVNTSSDLFDSFVTAVGWDIWVPNRGVAHLTEEANTLHICLCCHINKPVCICDKPLTTVHYHLYALLWYLYQP